MARIVMLILCAVFVSGIVIGYALHHDTTIVCQVSDGQANNCVRTP